MTRLTTLDLVVLVAYLAGITAWGVWLGRGQEGGRDYFLGGRDLPWPAVMLSVVATETSTLTFLSVPGVSYFGTLGFLQLTFGYLAGRIGIALLLLPRYYRGKLSTAYQLLEERFGRGTRRFTSGLFMVTRLLADSVRLFATAIPLALITGWPYWVSILVIGLLTLAYTWFGGIRAVVWIDVAQMGLYLVGAVAAAVLLESLLPGGWSGALASAAGEGKLQVVDTAADFGTPYTLWAGLFGGAFITMASHGADQLVVQRLLTTRSLRSSQRALVGSGVLVMAQFLVFLLVGIGLWSLYGGQEIARPDEVFARFIVDRMPAGLAGLLIAGVFAAAMSSLSSSLNSLSSAVAYDFVAPAAGVERDDPRLLGVGRWATLAWAALLVGGAVLFIPLSRDAAAVEVALGAASLTYGGLLGGFALALFVPSAGPRQAVTGMTAAVVSVAAVWTFARDALAWPWFAVLGTAIALAVGWGLARLGPGSGDADGKAGGSAHDGQGGRA